jgi:hypothetical protein
MPGRAGPPTKGSRPADLWCGPIPALCRLSPAPDRRPGVCSKWGGVEITVMIGVAGAPGFRIPRMVRLEPSSQADGYSAAVAAYGSREVICSSQFFGDISCEILHLAASRCGMNGPGSRAAIGFSRIAQRLSYGYAQSTLRIWQADSVTGRKAPSITIGQSRKSARRRKASGWY